MDEDQIGALAEDIKSHGQHVAVALQRTSNGDTLVLDGRNRLRASEVAGISSLIWAASLTRPRPVHSGLTNRKPT